MYKNVGSYIHIYSLFLNLSIEFIIKILLITYIHRYYKLSASTSDCYIELKPFS